MNQVRADSRDARMRAGSRPWSSSSRRPAIALGHALRQPTQMGANDISRWCTVWSLLERGSYVIDECPWQIDTQDKVFRAPKGATAPAGRSGAGPALLLEQARVVADPDRRDSLPGAGGRRAYRSTGSCSSSVRTLDAKARPKLSVRGQGRARETRQNP